MLNMLKEQIFDPMILMLLGAATYSALLNEWVEAGVIFFIVIINSIIGIIQEKKAQASLAALKTMSAPTATVIRNGSEKIVSRSEERRVGHKQNMKRKEDKAVGQRSGTEEGS